MTDPLLTAKDVAQRLGVSVDYTYRIFAKGDIAVTRIGGRTRVTEESLTDYIAACTAKPRKSRKGAAA